MVEIVNQIQVLIDVVVAARIVYGKIIKFVKNVNQIIK